MSSFLLTLAFIVTSSAQSTYANPSLLPHPTNISSTARLLYFHPHHFEFCNDGKESTILDEAFERYTTRILENSYPGSNAIKLSPSLGRHHHHHHHRPPHGFSKEDAIRSVSVFVVSSDQSLSLQTSETYTLRINAPTTIIHATNVYGALRAMESLAQLAFEIKINEEDGKYYLENDEEDVLDINQDNGSVDFERRRRKRHRERLDHLVVVNETSIWDTPRFRHRGLLIDTARHFLPLHIIKSQIDAMEMAKLNVLHWHIVDDQSFPYQSDQLPELSEQGAFYPDAIYSSKDIDEVVQYARARGVRVIPEFDMPGHAASWGKSHPELLTECDSSTSNIIIKESGGGFLKNLFKVLTSSWTFKPTLKSQQEVATTAGTMDPSKNSTFSLIWQLLREVSTRFPDAFLHIGGDEVNLDCWKNNKNITEWMQEQDLGKDVGALLPYFVNKVIGLAEAAGKEAMVWQEAFDFASSSSSSQKSEIGGESSRRFSSGITQLPSSTVVHVWKWASYLNSMNAATQQEQDLFNNMQSEKNTDTSYSRRTLKFDSNSITDTSLTATTLTHPSKDSTLAETTPRNSNKDQNNDDDKYWLAELAKVTASHRAILSAPWYLNLAPAGDEHTWERYWNVEPLNFKASIEQKERVLGGQASVWGELVDETNALSKTWPLAAAVAERLWADDSVRDVDAARHRMEEFRCKLVARGVPAAPLRPGFCLG